MKQHPESEPQPAEAVHAPPEAEAPGPGAPGVAEHAEAEAEAGPEEAPAGEGALASVLESLLFAADRPLPLARLAELCGVEGGRAAQALADLSREYEAGGRGIQLHEVAGGYQLRTAPKNAEFVQRLLQQKPVRLSRAQLETLAIVAYRQPITRPEIDDIRGVDSGGILKLLLERRLVRVLGKREEPGRPILYGTTREFLEFFNLRDLKDLPTLREFYELSEEHQAQVSAMGAALDDLQDKATPPPPPPLTRVELSDLDLGDDEAEMVRIDELIAGAKGNIPVDEVLRQAGVAVPPPAPPPSGSEGEPKA